MKKILLCLFFLVLYRILFAQAPESINYQGIARDKDGKEIINKSISLRFSILLNSVTGTSVYCETQSQTTNNFGLFNVKIGTGTMLSGNFMKIDWSAGKFFLKTEMDPNGGVAFIFLGTSQLLSVPYALFANKAIKSLNDLDTSAVNELQILKLSNDTLYLDRGGFVFLGDYHDKIEIQKIKTKLITDSSDFVVKINNERTERQAKDNILNGKITSDSISLRGFINTNATNIIAETNFRITSDNNLKTKIIADSTTLRTIINMSNTNLTNETNSRISGDNSLKTKQFSDSNYFKGLINNETTNRTNSDNTLQTNINNLRTKESTDSSMLAGYLTTTINNLTTETNNRTNADNTLQSNLTTETNNRISANNVTGSKINSDSTYFKGQISAETTNRNNADNALQSNISTETNSRITSDNSIKSKMSSDSSSLRAIINTSMTNEANSRIAGDNSLKSKLVSDSSFLKGLITAETTNRSNADNSLQTNITNEANSRISNDNNIKSKMSSDSSSLRVIINSSLTNETNSRISADQSLKTKEISDSTYLKGLLVAEITNRSNADNTLQSDISNETNTRIAYDNYLNSLRVSDSTFLKGLIATEFNNIVNTDNLLQLNISTEISSRINGENSIRNKLISDSSLLYDMIITTENNLTNEVNTRYSDELSLLTKIASDSSYLEGLITTETSSRIAQDEWKDTTSGIYYNSGNVGIGTSLPNISAALEINSSTQGFLPPRMDNFQMLALTPVEGLMIYNTTLKLPMYYNGTTWVKLDGSEVLYIGKPYQGGIIAYMLQTGDPGYVAGETHGLIVAPNDQSTGIQWYNGTYTTTGATSTALGTGNVNTNIIVSSQGAGNYAAKLCYDLVLGGYSDWYLPSQDELDIIYLNKNAISGFANNNYCWTSSEYSNGNAWVLYLGNGYQGVNNKVSLNYVRAVRSF
jgi:hypothetical protein